MKKNYFTVLLLLRFAFCYSQSPLVKQWDSRFGGNDFERFSTFQEAKDAGFIIGGYSLSGISGDKTQSSWGNKDFWIVKTDSLGNYLWDKRYGGTGDDLLLTLEQTADKGYILGGKSNSPISGDKTQPLWGVDDYWIVKIDSLGNYQWDKRYGGSGEDVLESLHQTHDGGYILGGVSSSSNDGDKTQPSWGQYDYWILKIDDAGNYQWDKRFGGIADDDLNSLYQTTDGGYILGGFSSSGISGDKTQSCQGGDDYWIVKIDELGEYQWDKRFGGTDVDDLVSLQQVNDGGYIIGGYSNSGIGGDKSLASWGGYDFWIVKTDEMGNYQWQKEYGGSGNEDAFGNITQTFDYGYVFAGISSSNISGNKTEDNLTDEQSWAVKTDSLGNYEWDKTLLVHAKPIDGFVIQTKDGCYLIGDSNDGDISGYKTKPAWNGSEDYWIVKFCDTTIQVGNSVIAVSENQVTISPNPFTQTATLNFHPKTKSDFILYDVFGRAVLQIENISNGQTIERGNLASGIYYYQIKQQGKTVAAGKVVVE